MDNVFSKVNCQSASYGNPIAKQFPLQCGERIEWFHGNCVGVKRSLAAKLDEHALQFTCNSCLAKDRQKFLEKDEENDKDEDESDGVRCYSSSQETVILSTQEMTPRDTVVMSPQFKWSDSNII
ncbi:hypothetical protein DAPPUDRAFT_112283 [Daphnia pulex]|uniref:Zinc finger PHD-type domain-containing protein n=1 Tax=Daphnia pulex TaxID=6669 RepID=E9HBJ3_DAPPU|nr:hypothetical protein DAPPUDRAFT_112283 [Daphnia pulex]|eukprot:EFX70906.1 hypothetical protein DAPPUDRAFT_112283 [Daphnia pulex]